MDTCNSVLVRGTIKIMPRTRPLEGAVAHVWIEEVSGQDQGSRVVAQTKIWNVTQQLRGEGGRTTTTEVPFELTITETEAKPNCTYSVQVWIDVIPDGERRSAEDLYSDRSYPVVIRSGEQFTEIIIA